MNETKNGTNGDNEKPNLINSRTPLNEEFPKVKLKSQCTNIFNEVEKPSLVFTDGNRKITMDNRKAVDLANKILNYSNYSRVSFIFPFTKLWAIPDKKNPEKTASRFLTKYVKVILNKDGSTAHDPKKTIGENPRFLLVQAIHTLDPQNAMSYLKIEEESFGLIVPLKSFQEKVDQLISWKDKEIIEFSAEDLDF